MLISTLCRVYWSHSMGLNFSRTQSTDNFTVPSEIFLFSWKNVFFLQPNFLLYFPELAFPKRILRLNILHRKCFLFSLVSFVARLNVFATVWLTNTPVCSSCLARYRHWRRLVNYVRRRKRLGKFYALVDYSVTNTSKFSIYMQFYILHHSIDFTINFVETFDSQRQA